MGNHVTLQAFNMNCLQMQQEGEKDDTSLLPQPEILEEKGPFLRRLGCGSPTAAPSTISRGIREKISMQHDLEKLFTCMTLAASPTSCCGQLAVTAFLERAA